MVVEFYERIKKADTIPAARMRMQDSIMPEMLPDAALLGAAVLLGVADPVVVAAVDVTILVVDAVVVTEPVPDVETVEVTERVTSPEEALSTRMLTPEGTAELATSTDVVTPDTTEATRTEPLDTAAEALDDAADTAEVARATLDETTEAKLDRALVWLGVGIVATVAEAATDARDVADATIWFTADEAEETITEFTAKSLKLA